MTEPMRWRMFAYMAALFIAGAMSGAAVMGRNQPNQTLKVGRTEEISALIRQRLNSLDLTPEQQQKFEPFIKQTSEELEASHLQCLQRCSDAVDKLHTEIETNLTTAQADKLKQLDEERAAMMKKKYNFSPAIVRAGNP